MAGVGKRSRSVAVVHVDLVRLLVWTYRDQKADVMSGKGLSTPEAALTADDPEAYHGGWGACGCAAAEHAGAVGAIIPGTAWRQNHALHPDAEQVHDQVVAMSAGGDWVGAALLRRYGRQGGTPDWCSDFARSFDPVCGHDDRPIQDCFDEVSVVKGRVAKHLYCPVVQYPPNEWIDLARGEYRAWHGALVRLYARMVDCVFTRYCLGGLGALAEPWVNMPLDKCPPIDLT